MFLGIDIGTGSVKAVAFDEKLRVKAQGRYENVQPGCAQYDIRIVQRAVQEAIQNIAHQLQGDTQRIKTICLTGHAPSVVFVDKNGNPASDMLTWQDRRALQEAKEIRDKWPHFQKDGTSFEAKLLWFYKQNKALFSGEYIALHPKDYLIYLLCGRFCIDSSTASCIAFYEKETWRFDETFVPACVMPPVLDSWQEAGVCDTEFSRACELSENTRVFMGGIDCFCEAVGAGGLNSSVLVDGTGTSTCLCRSIEKSDTYSFHVLPESSLQTRMLSTTGAAYLWFQNQFGAPEKDTLQNEVKPDSPVPVLFLPYLNGERSPVWDERAKGSFVGFGETTTKAEFLQAVFQGVAFAMRQNLEDMAAETQGQAPISVVHAVGGGNQSDMWLQIKANSSGLCHKRIEEPDAAAFGAALVGGYGAGCFSMQDLASLPVAQACFYPNEETKPMYDRLYESYLKLYPALKEINWDMSVFPL